MSLMSKLTSLFPGVVVEYPHEGRLHENELDNLLTRRMGGVLKGVYCIDEINAISVEIPAAYVVNSEVRQLPKGRWLAIYTNTHGIAFYFDIIGTPPHLPDIIEFFYSHATSCLHSTTLLTSNLPEVCGDCICFLLQITHLNLRERASKLMKFCKHMIYVYSMCFS